MKDTRILWLGMLCCFLSFCSIIKNSKSAIKQGVSGQALWMQGNFMPSPDKPARKESTPAIRTVYIYKAVKLNNVEGESPLFSKINGELTAKIKTDKDGRFRCSLLPGKYSVFTLEEDGKFFASTFDGEGNIAPFEVKKDEVTVVNIAVNYKAFY